MIAAAFLAGIDLVALEVVQALLPLVIFFSVFQVLYLKLPRVYVVNLAKGILLASLGMVLFLQGVNVAFLPAGREIGEAVAAFDQRWLLIPFGFFLGFLATYAEPAVRVLGYQVEESSSGYIKESLILYTLSLAVAVSVSLGMARLVYGIPLLWLLIPGYLLVIVLLLFTDKEFVGIAFDSGSVATGPMAVTFLLSLAVGVAAGIEGRNPVVDGFGLIALIALAPILSVLMLGILYRRTRGEET
ncbi:DUF1538 domain-containing protein [Methanoculleus sp. YWC-01]|jgi:hypothetical protein|uniref:DUF1538 domain-containing protein n=1 Tax=Methanoculleus nereidis TaxID=2735141 RepID=A0ABU3Z4A6_9EURY|nr:DUF1538 domain-containing protein [Methanoculleus sp. YWC-01]MCK9298125.1 DUF1538 domain-containing protein [Methanoculleus sp.]MDV4343394.1 DUF1538 domain-containing protein [Methanoculleus sp. YWC-01]PKL57068.1 MAG: DUF1538 domain-containing protein [Methanomicrobiales archaeon HGW-Methanomicrobiales-6]